MIQPALVKVIRGAERGRYGSEHWPVADGVLTDYGEPLFMGATAKRLLSILFGLNDKSTPQDGL
jgi:hypothetical protein